MSCAVAFAATGAGVSAQAGIFAAYDSTRHDRFSGGVTPNPNFLLSGYDLSGIANDSAVSAQGTVLISPQHVIAAWHYRPVNISFVGTDGVQRQYAVAAWTRLPPSGQGSDVAIGRLASPVLPSDNINPLPIAIGPDSAFVGHELYAFGQNNQAGRNVIDAIETVSSGSDPTVTTAYDYDSYVNGGTGGVGDDEIGLVGGDSGHASLILFNGQLGVLGTHFAVSEAPSQTVNYVNYSSLARDYLSQIDTIITQDGQTYSTLFVPEPSGVVVVIGALLLVRRDSFRRSIM